MLAVLLRSTLVCTIGNIKRFVLCYVGNRDLDNVFLIEKLDIGGAYEW